MATYNDTRQLLDKLTELERRMLSVETSSRAESAAVGRGGLNVYEGGSINFKDGGNLVVGSGGSIDISGGGLTIRGTGELNVQGTADFNNTARFQGDTTFNGPLTIGSGALQLPSGSISNDALAEQLEVKAGRATRSNYGLTTSNQTLATASISKPSWATRAAVFMEGFIFAEYTGQGVSGAYILGNCAGTTTATNIASQEENDAGVFGNTGRVSWSNLVNNPPSTLSFTLIARAEMNGEMNVSSRSWAELTVLAIFMRG